MEILNRQVIDEAKGPLNLYIGFEPSRSPSIGYLSLLKVLADLIKTGKYVTTILIADVHVVMGKGHQMKKRNRERVAYYQFIISLILKHLGVPRTAYAYRL